MLFVFIVLRFLPPLIFSDLLDLRNLLDLLLLESLCN